MVTDDDVLKVAFSRGVEIPVNPPPHQFFLTKDINVYTNMMIAIYKYHKACAEAESNMYGEILDCIPKL